jgi:hypothetical protein
MSQHSGNVIAWKKPQNRRTCDTRHHKLEASDKPCLGRYEHVASSEVSMNQAFETFASNWEQFALGADISLSKLVGEFFQKVSFNVSSEDKFQQLMSRWLSETSHLSRLDQVYMHPAYQQIIGMGSEALPYIFKELSKPIGRWFWALSSITGYQPFEGERGITTEHMKKAWAEWGNQHGYS